MIGKNIPRSIDEWRDNGDAFIWQCKDTAVTGHPPAIYELLRIGCEMHLKGAIMSVNRYNRWSSRSENVRLYSHHFDRLAEFGLVDKLNARFQNELEFRRNWRMIADMQPDLHYLKGAVSRDEVRALIAAAEDQRNGVVTWLRAL